MNDLLALAAVLARAALDPASWLVLLLAAALLALARGRRRGAAAAVGLSLLLVAALAALPLGAWLLAPLEARFPSAPPVSDPAGIVVLGGGEALGPSEAHGRPMLDQAGERILEAVLLARRFPEARLILAGRGGAVVAPMALRAAGVAEARLLPVPEARNTVEEARLTLAALGGPEGLGPGSRLLVTSAGHMPRAVAIFCAAGWTGLVPWPTDYRTGDAPALGWSLPRRLSLLESALRERIGLLAWSALGRAAWPPPEGCLAAAP